MDIIVNVIKECMQDVYLNVPIFPSEEGYRGFSASGVSVVGDVVESDVGKFEGFEMDKDLLKLKEERYRIKSQMIDEKRWFLCLFETCEKKFHSQRMADACINYHLGLLYKCKTWTLQLTTMIPAEITNVLLMWEVESESQRQHQ